MMRNVERRLAALEARASRDDVKHMFIAVIGRTPCGWECLQTGARVERLPGETDAELEARAIQADREARRAGAGAGWTMSLFVSHGPGWTSI